MSHEQMQRKIGEFLADPTESPSAKAVLKWQWGLYGDFFMALFNAIKLADEENLANLHKGFPTEVEGFFRWSRGNLALELRDKGLMD